MKHKLKSGLRYDCPVCGFQGILRYFWYGTYAGCKKGCKPKFRLLPKAVITACEWNPFTNKLARHIEDKTGKRWHIGCPKEAEYSVIHDRSLRKMCKECAQDAPVKIICLLAKEKV